MFSARLPWDRSENALAGRERARRDAGLPIIDLTESNPTRVGLHYPVEALREALGAAATHSYEPAPLGLLAAREAIARAHVVSGFPIEADRVVLTASSSESYSLLFKLLCNPGDAILVPEPSYPLFEYLARLDGVRSVGYRLVYDGAWHIDFDSLRSALHHAAATGGVVRALVVVNPNNPTGSFVTPEDVAGLGEICAAQDLAMISDEVFAAYSFESPRAQTPMPAAPRPLAATPEIAERALTFSLGGLSKASGLPQLKLGWIVAGGPAAAVRAALARLELITDTYLSVGGPVQRALPRLLELGAGIRSGIQHRVRTNRAALGAALGPGSPFTLLNAQGGWTAILRVPDLASEGSSEGPGQDSCDERWAMHLLTRDGVLVHPGYLFDMPQGAYLIASLLPPPETFLRGIAAVVARCGDSVP